MENKTARLTVLIDPARKTAFEKLCHSQDMTPSQVMRQLIRDYLAEHGVTFASARKGARPAAKASAPTAKKAAPRAAKKAAVRRGK